MGLNSFFRKFSRLFGGRSRRRNPVAETWKEMVSLNGAENSGGSKRGHEGTGSKSDKGKKRVKV